MTVAPIYARGAVDPAPISPTVQILLGIPAALLALFFVMRIVIRYERMSIADLRADRASDRELVTNLRVDIGVLRDTATEARSSAERAHDATLIAQHQISTCEERSTAQQVQIGKLETELGVLKLALNGATPPAPAP